MYRIQSVCLVDDAKGMQKLGKTLLEALGLTVHVASNGYEALRVIQTNQPDACFIDIEMPELDGLKLVSILRANTKFKTMPIAVLSSASSPFDREKGLLAGANLYLTKPFKQNILAEAISELEELHAE